MAYRVSLAHLGRFLYSAQPPVWLGPAPLGPGAAAALRDRPVLKLSPQFRRRRSHQLGALTAGQFTVTPSTSPEPMRGFSSSSSSTLNTDVMRVGRK